ncbi:MAG: T9SS type A sorting domain-containing protein [Candidatus Cloacimonadales bacterium]|nr:T9SS type A sorting domain-containing protein [Candidatus Cloacimonadales bacterium]
MTPWPVVDTLTSAGFDGDADNYELLPAYNPLETSTLGTQYTIYNHHDIVMKVEGQRIDYDDDNDTLIDEDNLGSVFDYNDPTDIFCFTIPFDEDGDGMNDEDCGYPGFESSIAYFYDYSPFGTEGERDWGGSASGNHHGEYEQLHLAITQEIYNWPVQYYADMAIIKNIIYNTSEIDTLFDVCVGYLMDCDIGPQSYSLDDRSLDDITSYITEDDIAYSYDDDGDYGFSPGLMGFKIYNPYQHNVECWYWNRGDGPHDWDPLNLTSNPTSNQKYWLMEGRNPAPNTYLSIPDNPAFQIDDPDETRFFYAISGDQQGYTNPTAETINIEPEGSFEFYGMILMDTSESGLQDKCELAEELIISGFDYNFFIGLPSLPFLKSANYISYTTDVEVNWIMLSTPDEFGIYYKQIEEPALNWQYIQIDPSLEEYVISGLTLYETYEFKVGCWFDDVYLESKIKTAFISGGADAEPNVPIVDSKLFQNYPNPFNPSTTISFSLNTETNEEAEIVIFNLKGQKIKTIPVILSGVEGSVIWNGTDQNDRPVSTGIYFYKLSLNGKTVDIKRMLMMK